MNRTFSPFQCEWDSVSDMKQTPRTWSNYYGSSLIETTLPPKEFKTTSKVTSLSTPTAVQLRQIQTNRIK